MATQLKIIWGESIFRTLPQQIDGTSIAVHLQEYNAQHKSILLSTIFGVLMLYKELSVAFLEIVNVCGSIACGVGQECNPVTGRCGKR